MVCEVSNVLMCSTRSCHANQAAGSSRAELKYHALWIQGPTFCAASSFTSGSTRLVKLIHSGAPTCARCPSGTLIPCGGVTMTSRPSLEPTSTSRYRTFGLSCALPMTGTRCVGPAIMQANAMLRSLLQCQWQILDRTPILMMCRLFPRVFDYLPSNAAFWTLEGQQARHQSSKPAKQAGSKQRHPHCGFYSW